jgi:putative SOS response-associated peptidase YedK
MVANSTLLAEHFGVLSMPEFVASPEIIPTQLIVTVNGEGVVAIKTWGIKVPKNSDLLTHIRSEKMSRDKTFKNAHRCLVPATGFFYRVSRKTYFVDLGSPVFAFAGLIMGRRVALITCATNRKLAKIHDRMPVILQRTDYARWIGEGSAQLLRPYIGSIAARILK